MNNKSAFSFLDGVSVCVALILCEFAASAQDFSSFTKNAPWLQGFFAEMAPSTPEFSAVGEMKMCDTDGATQFVLPMELSVSTNCLRWDADIMKIWPLPPQVTAAAKLTHTDKMTTITRIDTKQMFVIYPGIQAYVQYPISNQVLDEVNTLKTATELQKTELAQETVNDHLCMKTRVVELKPHPQTTTNDYVWYAADLQQFPVRMELHTKGQMLKFDFQTVHVGTPDASVFEIPTNYLAFANNAELMSYVKQKFQGSLDTAPK